MNLTSSLLALASQNLSSNLQDVSGYSYCQKFYGEFPQSLDCVEAIALLESGTAEVPYAVHSGVGPQVLPFSKKSGQSLCQAF